MRLWLYSSCLLLPMVIIFYYKFPAQPHVTNFSCMGVCTSNTHLDKESPNETSLKPFKMNASEHSPPKQLCRCSCAKTSYLHYNGISVDFIIFFFVLNNKGLLLSRVQLSTLCNKSLIYFFFHPLYILICFSLHPS